MRSSLADFLKKVINDNKQFAEGCEWKGDDAAPVKKAAAPKEEKKGKKEKKEKGEKKKGGCTLL